LLSERFSAETSKLKEFRPLKLKKGSKEREQEMGGVIVHPSCGYFRVLVGGGVGREEGDGITKDSVSRACKKKTLREKGSRVGRFPRKLGLGCGEEMDRNFGKEA